MKIITFSTMLLLYLLLTQILFAQKSSSNRHLEIDADKSTFFQKKQNSNLNQVKTYPSTLYNINYKSQLISPEEIALQYLIENEHKFGIKDISKNIIHSSISEMRSGYRVRFKQVFQGYPVYKSSIVVSINRNSEIVFVANSLRPDIYLNQEILIAENEAVQISKNHLALSENVRYLKNELTVFSKEGVSRLVRKVAFMPSYKNMGDWEFLIDAETGEIIQAKDQAFYYDGLANSGFGQVYNPDPITRSGASYGDAGFTDNDDADSNELTAQLVNVFLPEITFENGKYHLKSKYASIIDVEEPFTGLHSQDSGHFFFTRSQSGFEATNVFYHLDRSMRYINDTLGISLMPYHYDGGVRFDPHGLNGDDNSYYTSREGFLAFGDGNIDDGEDQDIVVHELGHGLHDWLTNGGLSQVDGLSEGCSDYWAQSYKRAKGFMGETNPKYNWLFSWDGHNPFWEGRVTNYGAKYPGGLINHIDYIHFDGQIWATALMKVYDRIGKFATDINFLDGLSMLNERSSQRDAAFAFIQSDRDNFDGQHLADIVEIFTNTGYITDPVTIFIAADSTGGIADFTVNFEDQSFAYPDSITSWEWDFESDGVIDSYEKNPQHTYTKPGLYTVTLEASDGVNTSTGSQADFISVNDGVFVWEGVKEGRDNSGRYIHNLLGDLGVSSVYSHSDKLPTSLIGYKAVFLSFGNAASNRAHFNNDMATTIIEYLDSGGNLYLEGGDALGLKQSGNTHLLTLLGLQAADDGTSENRLSENLIGQPLSIFNNIHFKGSNQDGNFSIDRFHPDGNGIVALIEANYGNVAIQAEGAYGQKTVVFSYAMAELIDRDIPSSREDFLGSITRYFNLELNVKPRFSLDLSSGHAPLTVNFTDYSFYDINDPSLSWQWDFDNDGSIDSDQENPIFTYNEPGRYDVKLILQNDSVIVNNQFPDFVRVFNGESALSFNTQENYVEFEPDSGLNITTAYTLEFWMNPSSWGASANGYGRIFDKDNLRIFLRKTNVGNYNAESLIINMRHEEGKSSTYGTPDSSIKLNTWQHISVAYNSENNGLRVFINGEIAELSLIAGEAAGPVIDNSSIALVLADAITKKSSYSGELDEIRLWNIARSTFSIQNHWTHYVDPESEGLVAYWQFNEANGDTLKDLTANNHNGFILNADWVEGKPDILAVGIKDNFTNFTAEKFDLYANYPNPFNPQTNINYQLGTASDVKLIVYDILGREVAKLVNKKQQSGKYKVTFNASNLASGVYYYKITAGKNYQQTRKMLLLR